MIFFSVGDDNIAVLPLRRLFSSVNCIQLKRFLYLSLFCSQLQHSSVLRRPHLKMNSCLEETEVILKFQGANVFSRSLKALLEPGTTINFHERGLYIIIYIAVYTRVYEQGWPCSWIDVDQR